MNAIQTANGHIRTAKIRKDTSYTRTRARDDTDYESSPPSFASGNDRQPTPDEAKATLAGYVAYFGTYTVDAAKNIVGHHVEGSLAPSFNGTDQPRPFILSGDRLLIGDDKRWRRVLERVK